MQQWIEKMKWEIVTAVIAAIGFVQWIIFNILKSQFLTKDECEKVQRRCNNSVCRDIEELKVELRAYRVEAENKRDIAKDLLNEQLGQIRIFMARIDQKIRDDRWGSNGKDDMI